ncbi:hypothetical protein [Vagococcus salmoninarum]|uniref:hypothetical protein n=1 Tax=Vagococcus salmoninarum TaxID=2739 RepID=UPI0028D00D07|nr:hypothetical protein [Vagococcus salmoninarum]
MTKRRLGVLLLSLLIVGSIYTTYALFNNSQTKKGIITTGKVKIALNDLDGLGNPFTEPSAKMVPGDDMQRIVTVKNEGNKPVFVRVKATKELVDGKVDFSLDDLALVSLNYATDWQVGADDYYYYQSPLVAGGETTPLFTQVSLSKEADNRFSDQKIAITLQADGVQADNNGLNSSEASGWPN